jgi:hypothetical protein
MFIEDEIQIEKPNKEHILSSCETEISSANWTQFLLCILYQYPEDDPLRSKHVAELNNITFTGCVDGNSFPHYELKKAANSEGEELP